MLFPTERLSMVTDVHTEWGHSPLNQILSSWPRLEILKIAARLCWLENGSFQLQPGSSCPSSAASVSLFVFPSVSLHMSVCRCNCLLRCVRCTRGLCCCQQASLPHPFSLSTPQSLSDRHLIALPSCLELRMRYTQEGWRIIHTWNTSTSAQYYLIFATLHKYTCSTHTTETHTSSGLHPESEPVLL